MSDISITYKEQTIDFQEHIEQWRWNEYYNSSLKKVKDHIDRALKEDFEQQQAYCKKWRDIEVVTVTSRTEEGSYWVKDKKGKRSKENTLFAFNEKNANILEQIKETDAAAAKLYEHSKALENSLEPFKVKDRNKAKEA